jgi:hypothetical protein
MSGLPWPPPWHWHTCPQCGVRWECGCAQHLGVKERFCPAEFLCHIKWGETADKHTVPYRRQKCRGVGDLFHETRKEDPVDMAQRLAEIRNHPEQHKHSFRELHECCRIGGAISTKLLDAHEGIIGHGKCDVTSGPCACGAFHK